MRVPGPLRAFFLRLKRKQGRNKAIVAVAAKLARIVWMMLRRDEDYYYSPSVRRTLQDFASSPQEKGFHLVGRKVSPRVVVEPLSGRFAQTTTTELWRQSGAT